MKTQGEIEAAICDVVSRFELEFMGRSPEDIRAHLLGDLLVIRLQGVLTAAEQHLVRTLSPEKVRNLLKQMRTQLIEIARPVLSVMVAEAISLKTSRLNTPSPLSGEGRCCSTPGVSSRWTANRT